MYNFKTKYQSCKATIDELQYVRQGDSAPSLSKDDGPKRKQANYNFSIISPVSGGKHIPILNNQLTGKGVNNKQKIWHETTGINNTLVDGQTTFGIIPRFNKRRLFKKDGIIYDLTF